MNEFNIQVTGFNYLPIASLLAFAIFGMGLIALILGISLFIDNRKSATGRAMFATFISVFFWDSGYAWMSLCHESEFAYIPRAIALFAVFTFMFFAIDYVAKLSKFPKKYKLIMDLVYIFISAPSWFGIIQKSAVSFQETPWGYWYTSRFTVFRALQFVGIAFSLIYFYIVLIRWKKNVVMAREKYLCSRFMFYGPIMLGGSLLDTFIPTLLKSAAIPGSAVAAFIASILLYSISRKYRAFGVSERNVSIYAFNEVSIPVLIFNTNGELELFNKITPSILKKRPIDILGKKIADLFEAAEDISDEFTERRIYLAKDTKLYCELDTTIVNDDFGQILYRIVFVQDVSATQNAMRIMKEGREIAEHANKAKTSFLANMSHEIRTPMNAIIGMSELLTRQECLDEESQQMVRNIKESGNGLLSIINDILDISKIESEKYELINDNYSLPDLINNISVIGTVRVQETPVVFNVEVAPGIPTTLNGDEVRVRQILINLVGNAVKFTKTGSITMKVTGETLGDKYKLMIDIADTGIGMKSEDLDKIFGAFTQVDTRKNRSINGTGLGLAISKQLSILMGGDITVESEYGKGSVFHLAIMQNIVDNKVISEELALSLSKKQFKSEKKKSELKVIPKPGKKILVVDDIHMNLMVAKGLMKIYQVEVDTAESGAKAIEMVQQKDYDLVFMDHMMPVMDGVDAMHAIRKLGEKYEKLTIIALTANVVDGAKKQLIEEGMDDYLAKPIERASLNDILDKWLSE